MEKSGKRFVILDLWKKNLGVKHIRADMNQMLGPDAYSKVQIAPWVQRFEQGDFSCKAEFRPGGPLLSFGPALSRFLSKYPFASARTIAAHFGVARDSMKMIRMHGISTIFVENKHMKGMMRIWQCETSLACWARWKLIWK
jgi:hypothetical protein